MDTPLACAAMGRHPHPADRDPRRPAVPRRVRDAATGHVLGTQVLLNAAQVQDIIAGRPAHLDTTWTLPNSAPAGQYALHLAWVRTPALAAGQPMRWNMAGTEPDGSLRVATLKRN